MWAASLHLLVKEALCLRAGVTLCVRTRMCPCTIMPLMARAGQEKACELASSPQWLKEAGVLGRSSRWGQLPLMSRFSGGTGGELVSSPVTLPSTLLLLFLLAFSCFFSSLLSPNKPLSRVPWLPPATTPEPGGSELGHPGSHSPGHGRWEHTALVPEGHGYLESQTPALKWK